MALVCYLKCVNKLWTIAMGARKFATPGTRVARKWIEFQQKGRQSDFSFQNVSETQVSYQTGNIDIKVRWQRTDQIRGVTPCCIDL